MATGPAGNGLAGRQVQHLGPTSRRAALLAGSATLLATGGIHLDLYLTGYRHIPTIGWLFLVQCVVAVLLGLAGLVSAAPAVALAGGGFAAATLGGYVLSLWTGLFGFHEIRTTAGVVAGALEVAGLVLLTGYAASGLRDRERHATRPGRLEGLGRAGTTVVAPLGALATLALVLAVTLAGPPGGSTATAAGTRHVSPSRAPRADTSSVRVTISNFAFIPAHVHVLPGERIVVTNRDSVTHTFTAMPGTTPVGHFTTGDIAPGTTKSVVAPTKPGTYHFYCQIHPFMTGTLTVG
jgi:plastocyanin